MKCKNPKCEETFELNTTNKNGLKREYCKRDCKNEHYRATHREYYRQMGGKHNIKKLDNVKYAEIDGRVSYVPKKRREEIAHAKTLKELHFAFMDTVEGGDQGAYL